MTRLEKNITQDLFSQDLRSIELVQYVRALWNIDLTEMLADSQYYEIDEYPLTIADKGIVIGFASETTKTCPRIEYIDIQVDTHPDSVAFLEKKIDVSIDYDDGVLIQKTFTPCSKLCLFYSLYNENQLERIGFVFNQLRYELLITTENKLSKIRVYLDDESSDVNMRPF